VRAPRPSAGIGACPAGVRSAVGKRPRVATTTAAPLRRLPYSDSRLQRRNGNARKAESFMKTLKVEAVYLMDYQTFEDVTAEPTVPF
jgi:hypothetical protein